MDFKPNFKRKRNYNKRKQINPFPQASKQKSKAIFTGFSVEVQEWDVAVVLYKDGCYGKGSRPRSAPRDLVDNFSDEVKLENESLLLELEEAYFLSFIIDVLEIVNPDGVVLSQNQIFEEFTQIKPNFINYLVAYIYLKSKGWVIRSGIKFGGDFLIYKQGVQFYHASFVVLVGTDTSWQLKDLQGAQRVAETSDKDILFLNIYPPTRIEAIDYQNNIGTFKVTEMIPKRFDFKKQVQNKSAGASS